MLLPKSCLTVFALALLELAPASAQPTNAAESTEGAVYLGQKPPGNTPWAFVRGLLVEPHGAPAVLRDGSQMIIVTMEEGTKSYDLIDGELVPGAVAVDFPMPPRCNAMTVGPSGNSVYFMIFENYHKLFYVTRKRGNTWTDLEPLGEGLKTTPMTWEFSIAANENLYYATDSLLVSVFDGTAHLAPVPLELENGGVLVGGSPHIAPDESYVIYVGGRDLYISYKTGDGKWSQPINLGPEINTGAMNNCPRVSPNGKYLFFNSRREGPKWATYWVAAGFIETLRPADLD